MDLPFLFAQYCSQNGKVAQLLLWERSVPLHRVACLPSWPYQQPSEFSLEAVVLAAHGQAPMTSIRKGALPFSGWLAAVALLVEPALPLQEEAGMGSESGCSQLSPRLPDIRGCGLEDCSQFRVEELLETPL